MISSAILALIIALAAFWASLSLKSTGRALFIESSVSLMCSISFCGSLRKTVFSSSV